MKYAFVLLSLFGCAAYNAGPNGPFTSGPIQESCTVVKGQEGATVSCPDGTNVFIPSGTEGIQGYGAGIITNEVNCPMGSNGGIQVTTFVDKNNNGILDLGEPITSINLVCGGLPGVVGPQGAQGPSGTSSVVSVSVASNVECPTGGYVLSSQNGNDAATSVDVCNGTTGEQGNPGTEVTTEQFCSQYTGSYPGTFPEYGLLINGALYAVYWDGINSWLSKIYPGTYRSTSTTAPCNFTVNDDGSISNEN